MSYIAFATFHFHSASLPFIPIYLICRCFFPITFLRTMNLYFFQVPAFSLKPNSSFFSPVFFSISPDFFRNVKKSNNFLFVARRESPFCLTILGRWQEPMNDILLVCDCSWYIGGDTQPLTAIIKFV